MKKITPFKRIDKYAFEEARFETIEEAEKYIRKRGTGNLDYLVIDNVLYTMDEFDMSGKIITYYNKRTGNQLQLETANRYDKVGGFSDAVLTLLENYGCYRNDIVYAD